MKEDSKPFRLTFANQKGGAGKTTLSVLVARDLSERLHKKVLFVDLDVQGNASYALKDASCGISVCQFLSRDLSPDEISRINAASGIVLLNSTADLANDLSLQKGSRYFESNLSVLNADCVIIDTPPALGNKQVISLQVSKYVIIPLEADFFSIQGTGGLINAIRNLSAENGGVKLLGLVANKIDARSGFQKQVIAKLSSTGIGKKFLDTVIHKRDCIPMALAKQISLTKLRSASGRITRAYRLARREISALTDEILKKAETA